MRLSRFIPRFSLRSLILLSLLAASGAALWRNWEPWQVERSVKCREAELGGGAAFSRDGRIAVFWSTNPEEFADVGIADPPPYSQELAAFDSLSGKPTPLFAEIPKSIWDVDISSDDVLAIGPEGAYLWDCRKRGPPRKVPRQNQTRCAISPAGKLAMLWRPESQFDQKLTRVMNARLFEIQIEKQAEPQTPPPFPELARQTVWSPDDRLIVALDHQNSIYVVESRSMKLIKQIEFQRELFAAAMFTPDGREFWVKTYDDETIVFDTTEWKELRRAKTGDNYWSETQWLSDGSAWMASGTGRSTTEIFDSNFKLLGSFGSYFSKSKDTTSTDRIFCATYDSIASYVNVYDFKGESLCRFTCRASGTYIMAMKAIGDQHISIADRNYLMVFSRRRPERWWGVAWLPEFWLTLLFAGAFAWSLLRDRRELRKKTDT